MKLLFIIPEYHPYSAGGIATFYNNLFPYLVDQGCEIRVLAGNAFTSHLPSYQQGNINIDFLDHNAVSHNLEKFAQYHAIPELQRHLAAAWTAWEQTNGGQGYDLVETTDWGMLFVPWIVSENSPPTVVQLHGSIGQIDFHDPQIDTQLQNSLARLLEVSLLSVADELQANSSLNAKTWESLTNRDVTYIPPALSIMSDTQSLEESENGLVVGRIQYWKGVTDLCEALELMGDHAPIINWIGRDTVYRHSGDSMSVYLKQNYPNIWGEKIKPLGTFSVEKTRQFQAKAKSLIVPSKWDVFNYTCVEGMAQGKTVLCSNGAGAVNLITDGVNGLTFIAGDSQNLATKLETLLSFNDTKRQQIGRAAQETVQTKLAPKKIVQQRIEIYEKLIQRGKFLVRPNKWLINAVSPSKSVIQPLGLLDQLPLRELSNYLLKRTINKVLN